LVTNACLTPIDCADGQLDNRERSPRRSEPPGTQGSLYFDNAPIAANEQNVDRELHEERVNARTGREDEAVTFGKRRSA
jgi:hypothetical protein